MKNKDDECFGDDIEEIPDTDFDFEGNLALFDKAAVFEEIDTYERRSGTRSRGIPNERPTRYRHDENILESEPIVYRRITVPHNVSKEFCTGELHNQIPHPIDCSLIFVKNAWNRRKTVFWVRILYWEVT